MQIRAYPPIFLERGEKMDKIKPINFKNLKNIFNEMSDDKGMPGLALIKELEFMKKTLTKLKRELDKKGVVTKMSQGSYSIERANPALTQYNAMIKNYQSTVKLVNDLLPKDSNENPDDFDNDDLD